MPPRFRRANIWLKITSPRGASKLRNGEHHPGSAVQFRALAKPQTPVIGQRCRLFHDQIIMRVKFEAIDASGKVHKRSSAIRIYSHCVVIHFAAQSPSKFWPEGIVAFCHAEWAASWELAERHASRWRKKPDVEAIEILEARQV